MRLTGISRYLKALKMMERPNGASNDELREALCCSPATVHRYKQLVERLGFPLTTVDSETHRGEKRHLILPPLSGKKLDSPFRLTKHELVALHFIRGYARLFKGTELAEDIDNVFEKIGGSVDPKLNRLLKRVRGLFIPALKFSKDYTSKEIADRIADLTDAILGSLTCTVVYNSFADDRVKTLTIDPLHFFEHNGGLYLFARVTGYKDVRMLAVERIRSVKMSDENFIYPKGFDPEKRLESAFTIFDEEPTKFRIRFSKSQAKYIGERQWAKDQSIKTMPDGSIVLTMTTSGRNDVMRWVLGYGANAELLEPADLREEIREELRNQIKAYGNEPS